MQLNASKEWHFLKVSIIIVILMAFDKILQSTATSVRAAPPQTGEHFNTVNVQ